MIVREASIKRCTGWIMIEVLFAVALLALTVSIYQQYSESLNQRLASLQSTYRLEQYSNFRKQTRELFQIELSSGIEFRSLPSCVRCRNADLKRVLEYGMPL